jgi:hypothetical protein
MTMARTTLDLREQYARIDSRADTLEFHGLDDSQLIDFHMNMSVGHGRTMPRDNPLELGSYPSSDSWSY